MAVTNRGSILISTANDIGSSLVDVIGGEGYSPNEWAKKVNICGIAASDIPTALDNIEESTPSGTDRGDISLDTGNAVGAVLNKKFNTARGFKPSEWASAISKLTELEVKTASGAIASFNDGADDVPIESATFEFSPNQDLNGQDAPYPPGGGKNLFSVDEIYAHGFWNPNGSWSNSDYYYAYIIKADPETDYTYNAGFTGITTFLDSNGDYISGINQGSGLASRTVTTPANCAYITASILITNLNGTQQIEKGSSSTAYAPYNNICPIAGYEGLTIYQNNNQYFDKTATDTNNGYISGRWIDNNGTPNTNASYNTSEYIAIKGGVTYTLSGISGSNPSICFYDGEKTFLRGTKYNGATTLTFTTDRDVAYCRLSFREDNKDNVQLEVGATATSVRTPTVKTPIVDSFGRTVYGGSRKADGDLNETYASFRLTEDRIDAATEYTYSGKVGIQIPGVFPENVNRLETHYFSHDQVKQGASTDDHYAWFGSSTGNKVLYWIGILDSMRMTLAEWKIWAKTQYIQICYKLPTQNTYDLDDIYMSTYYGGNNIYSDTNGDTTVAYRADIDLSAT